MRQNATLVAIVVVGLGVGAGLLWRASTADAGTRGCASAPVCGSELVADCSGCPGSARAAQQTAPVGCPRSAQTAPEAAPAACAHHEGTACPHEGSPCPAECTHHADANCPCKGDRTACTEEMKTSCEHRATCDRACSKR